MTEVCIASLSRVTADLESDLIPFQDQSEVVCDACDHHNEIEEGTVVVKCQGCEEGVLGGLPKGKIEYKRFQNFFFFLKFFFSQTFGDAF